MVFTQVPKTPSQILMEPSNFPLETNNFPSFDQSIEETPPKRWKSLESFFVKTTNFSKKNERKN